MVRIGLISDTHGYLDPAVFRHFESCDEIWHAGDFGDYLLLERLREWKKLRAVWGNIDDNAIRNVLEEKIHFEIEALQIAMIHIGGYPGRYAKNVKIWLKQSNPGLFICGHSHIVKVQQDRELGLLHLNPGAAGKQGWHKMRTIMRFQIDEGKISGLELIELGNR